MTWRHHGNCTDEGLVRGSPGGGMGGCIGGCLDRAMKSLLTAHLAALPLMLCALDPALAQQPLAVPPMSSTPFRQRPACPLLVPLRDSVLQPLRIEPRQVPRKNAGGCLSAADALYSADGCPLKLCPRAVPNLDL